ncbi:amino acid ABC transporter permease (plasmid) [Paracoccus versutus]|uniref:Glutamate/aspartate import permease protein GltK n=2 Tax=Paracoccaceae TaxID=31989 RepID=A0AAQ0KKH7_PARVE|nr:MULTISPECIES: amino acid ABC transporter permease [Paracoccus]MBT0782383.1 amino acid ABC transporter permease [Paracoccus sp. pheM1]WGR62448.1 amino acid ABC transporter permease [Paracoccus ferrooxidans]KGJ10180.1 ABC transporter permease [Paracoccus versutus]RDD70204.1 amino acid ABC transporter permease [Paracoccus versutus]RDD93173.1 amino acid ABC transporter permease [Paracoccus pantotrophus]
MNYSPDFSVVLDNWPVLARGLWVTIQIWLPSIALGLIGGFLISQARLSSRRWLSIPSLVYVELFRDTPVLIQLIWFFYAFPILIGVQLTPFTAALLGLTLNTTAYSAEIFRGGIKSIHRGQMEGAKAIGMTHAQAMRRVILPQVVKRMLPAFTNRMIEVAKMSSLASVISVHELMYQGRLLSSTYYRPFEILTAVAFIYFVLIYPGTFLAGRLEKRLARSS